MKLSLALSLAACVLLLGGCSTSTAPAAATKVAGSDELVRWFAAAHPDSEVVTSALGDVTGDGTGDLVVVYRDADDTMHTRVVISGDSPAETNDVPAPAEDQRITFRDIDDTSPVEFIVRGSKGADIGFAIYRVEGTKLTDLFGENMDRCCDSGASGNRPGTT